MLGGAGGYSTDSPAAREQVFSSTTHPSVPRNCVNGHPPLSSATGAFQSMRSHRCLEVFVDPKARRPPPPKLRLAGCAALPAQNLTCSGVLALGLGDQGF